MNSRALLSVAVGGDYPTGQDRLRASLDALGDDTPRLIWRGLWPGRPHATVPYGFKVDAFDHAGALGFSQGVWLDCQLVASRSLEPLWQYFEHTPVLLLEDPDWNVGEWTSDAGLSLFSMTRDAAMALPLCYAKVIGIDLSTSLGRSFLAGWRELRDRGGFNGPWTADGEHGSFDVRFRGHRHDQSCASWLAHDLGITMAPMRPFLSRDPADGSVFVLQDL